MHLKMRMFNIWRNCKASEQMIKSNHEEITYKALKIVLHSPKSALSCTGKRLHPLFSFSKDCAKDIFLFPPGCSGMKNK